MATLQFKDDCDSMKVGLREFDSSWTWQANELRAIGWSRDVEMEKRFSSPSVICHSFVLDADVELIECGKSLAILRRNLGPILPMTKRALMLGHQGPRLMDYLQGIVMSSPRPRVMYIEACESGSVFEGIMPENLDIYITTASNAEESSWGTYCPGMEPSPPPEYMTCLGDLYSVAWMEDSDTHNLKKETVQQQYDVVKYRTSNYNTYNGGSHVMEYGNKSIKAETLYLYQGSNPVNKKSRQNNLHPRKHMEVVNQRDADLFFLWRWVSTSTYTHKCFYSNFLVEKGPSIISFVRAAGLPLVDDWGCLKAMVQTFESQCGSLTQYGMKHMRGFANICNNGISKEEMKMASLAACSERNSGMWSPSKRGYSA
ncbi:hypothetical protein GIB67_025421 [Kingdonia uniflora]|uniref:Legumain prodomain domain-containing protein n=1 Tax=Kingdonia uniflora TaxID=39325 RepID=A0A7J7NU60_9MAGN|nr:hypothetical protein GIB67_025421 [Kingdonia uniflora]